jgi:hypothetical protein
MAITLKGFCFDKFGNPLQDVDLTFALASDTGFGATVDTTVSDANGMWSKSLANGTYDVKAQRGSEIVYIKGNSAPPMSVGTGQVTSDIVILTGTQTLTNKAVNLANNTVTGTTAEFNTALSDGDFATLAGTETLTNKTINASQLVNESITPNKIDLWPRCKIYNGSPVVINNLDILSFDTEAFDSDSMYTGVSPQRITATTAGLYLVYWNLVFLDMSKVSNVGLLVNAALAHGTYPPANAGANTTYTGMTIVSLSATQYMTLQVTLSASTTLTAGSYFEAIWLGPAS